MASWAPPAISGNTSDIMLSSIPGRRIAVVVRATGGLGILARQVWLERLPLQARTHARRPGRCGLQGRHERSAARSRAICPSGTSLPCRRAAVVPLPGLDVAPTSTSRALSEVLVVAARRRADPDAGAHLAAGARHRAPPPKKMIYKLPASDLQ